MTERIIVILLFLIFIYVIFRVAEYIFELSEIFLFKRKYFKLSDDYFSGKMDKRHVYEILCISCTNKLKWVGNFCKSCKEHNYKRWQKLIINKFWKKA